MFLTTLIFTRLMNHYGGWPFWLKGQLCSHVCLENNCLIYIVSLCSFATLVVGAVCVRTDPLSIKTQRINLTKFHCSSLFENNGSQTFLSKSGSINFGSFRNDSYIKGYVAKTSLQKHHLICNACKAMLQRLQGYAAKTMLQKHKPICNACGRCRVCAERSAVDKNINNESDEIPL